LLSLGVGLLVGAIYGVLNVRIARAPGFVALVGLLGILLGEQLVPLAKRLASREPVSTAWVREQWRAPHIRTASRQRRGAGAGRRTSTTADVKEILR